MWLRIPQWPGASGIRRPRISRALVLRIALIVSATIVLLVGIRVWTAGPDTVRVIVTRHRDIDTAVPTVTTVYDRTVHDAALAQRFQHDLAALPIAAPGARFSCGEVLTTYDTYILEWSRSGLFVERATADAPGCNLWVEDGVLVRLRQSDAIFTDLHAALGTPLPCGITTRCQHVEIDNRGTAHSQRSPHTQ